MLESILLVLYAIASIALAVWVCRAFRLRLNWSHPDMRKPVFDRTVRSTGGAGALGAADAISSAALTSASPNVVMMFIIVVAGLFGGFIGAGVLPALVGGIGQPNWMGMMALVVATLAWTWIGGCLALPVLALAFGLAPVIIGIGLFGFAAMAFWQTFSSGHPNPFGGNGTWQAAFGARVDYNVCAAGTSLITLGNPAEIGRKCKQQIVGSHPVEGRFAGVYNGGAGGSAGANPLSFLGSRRGSLIVLQWSRCRRGVMGVTGILLRITQPLDLRNLHGASCFQSKHHGGQPQDFFLRCPLLLLQALHLLPEPGFASCAFVGALLLRVGARSSDRL